MACEICGAENVFTYPTLVDGVTLRTCENCGGKRTTSPTPVFSSPSPSKPSYSPPARKINRNPNPYLDEGLDIIADLGKKVHEKREKLKIERVQLAAMLKIKESVLQKIEHGEHQPDDALLLALEHALQLKLRNKQTDELIPNRSFSDNDSKKSFSSSGQTLSDILDQQLAKKSKNNKEG